MRYALPCAILLATAVSGAARDRDSVLVAMPDGKPELCVSLRAIRETIVRDDRTIDFRMNGDRIYRVTLPNGCPSLGFERRFAYATSLSQLCSTDIITVLHQGPLMRGASCGLAPFQPVKLAKAR